MDNGLHLKAVEICRGGQPLLQIDAQVAPGEILTVMGPSGSGKSTLLSFLTGHLAPAFTATGQVILDGSDVTTQPPEHRKIGILFQDDLLFPHLSVGANLAFGLRGRTKSERQKTIETALSDVGLKGFETRDPATLSGGQKARVALMRVLLSDPKALLLDEAFSGLDTDRRAQIRDLTFDHARKKHLPVVMVSHDIDDAKAAGGQVIQLGA
ncbi:MAG: ATP-binding cassette domain-containing protein [Thalassococcus sp.]|uniref:ATP-binding cassette domain-containing protein n=1 Tax=Thalassococcus sp. TaxID=1928858 RepID=UPI001B03355E|nr:ATP-binding cassette domain-containing protein [Thalassococcus sp.]MBO6868552.1 ATP-binding cassette domain-containing protein [Thalassococcus sp.]